MKQLQVLQPFRFLLLILLAAIMGTSCVSRKKLTYLQHQDDDEKEAFFKLERTRYKVQPNDILNITIRSFDEETARIFNSAPSGNNLNAASGDLIFYLTGFSVDLDGNIDMPVVGKVSVAGKNLDEVRTVIDSELSDYFKTGGVYASVQLAGVRFSVVGDVAAPGKYVVYQNQVNIFEALATAGDITIVGDRREVEIIRQTPEGVLLVQLDLTDRNVLTDPYFFLQPNDILNVKPLPVKSWGIGTTGFSTLAQILGVLASTATLIFTIDRLTQP